MSAGVEIVGEPRGAAGEGSELGEVPLFAGIAPAELDRIEHFMAPFACAAGEVLFRQGEDGEQLYVIHSGRVEVHVELTGGEVRPLACVGPHDVLGELALLGGARRSGTAVAREPAFGWMLHRSSFEMLRLDAGAGAVELVARLTELILARLRARCATIADQLAEHDAAPAPLPDVLARAPHAPAGRAASVSAAYLETLLCFSHFHGRDQVEAVIAGVSPVQLPAGAVALAPGRPVRELLLVLRGALDVSIRRGHTARRVRLAGPGRFVGHVGALDGHASPVVAHAREPVVLLALPAERVRAMLRDPGAPARRFCAGLADDVARALRAAERPVARTAGERSAAPG